MTTTIPFEPPKTKRILAQAYRALGLDRLDFIWSRLRPHVLAVNYHHTPLAAAGGLECQLEWFRQHYVPVNRENLVQLLRGDWPHKRPGVMIHFDDGFADNAAIAAPTLERYGFTGWFHVITDRVDATTMGQSDPAEPSAQRSMTWEQAWDLRRRGHEICSHTCSHRRMKADVSVDELAHEVLDSYARIEAELGEPPVGFCWPGGERDAYDARAMALVLQRYQFAFPGFTHPIQPGESPYAITRSNIEATWNLDVVRLSIGKLWELKHRGKAAEYRRKVYETAAQVGSLA